MNPATEGHMSRRNLLGIDRFSRDGRPLPPWALDAKRFSELCTSCGDCVDACETEILVMTDVGPRADFLLDECTFCGACERACEPKALDRDAVSRPWSHKVKINGRCLAVDGVMCRVCGDICEPRALRIRPTLLGISIPEVDLEACTGCGACVGPCPAGAISMTERKSEEP